jgi:hypothetical protein
MVLESILYVSESKLVIPRDEGQITQIVDWSKRWNEAVGITGALLFTEEHFSQFIEGPPEMIAELFGKLQRDPRHTNLDILEKRTARHRIFADWSLAYSGPEMFIDREHLDLFRRPTGRPRADIAADIKELMIALAG